MRDAEGAYARAPSGFNLIGRHFGEAGAPQVPICYTMSDVVGLDLLWLGGRSPAKIEIEGRKSKKIWAVACHGTTKGLWFGHDRPAAAKRPTSQLKDHLCLA